MCIRDSFRTPRGRLKDMSASASLVWMASWSTALLWMVAWGTSTHEPSGMRKTTPSSFSVTVKVSYSCTMLDAVRDRLQALATRYPRDTGRSDVRIPRSRADDGHRLYLTTQIEDTCVALVRFRCLSSAVVPKPGLCQMDASRCVEYLLNAHANTCLLYTSPSPRD